MKNLLKIFSIVTIIFFSCKPEKSLFLSPIQIYYNFISTIEGTANGAQWKRNNWKLLGSFTEKNVGVYSNIGRGSYDNTVCVLDSNRFAILISQFNEFSELRETMVIDGILKQKGQHGVIDLILPSCDIKDSVTIHFSTSQAGGDVSKDSYSKIDIKYKNNFVISDFQPNQVKGLFDVKLIMTERKDKPNAIIYPDTLHLKGTFDIRK